MKIVVWGAAGRMGQAILQVLSREEDLVLGAALDMGDNIKKGILEGEVLIDFTSPEGTLVALKEAVIKKKKMVIGTTGLNKREMEQLKEASRKIPIVYSPNMSIGVNVVFKLLSDAASALGDAYDIEVVEMHHRGKKDAPSGTALRMGEVLARTRGTTLSKVGRFSREGAVEARPTGEIGILSLRGGDVVGEHTVLFAGPGERIEITHRANSRENFARGAILAARWVFNQPPGFYDMMDVLNLKK